MVDGLTAFTECWTLPALLSGVLLATGLLALLPGHSRTIFLIATVPGAAAVWLTFKLREAKKSENIRQDTDWDI